MLSSRGLRGSSLGGLLMLSGEVLHRDFSLVNSRWHPSFPIISFLTVPLLGWRLSSKPLTWRLPCTTPLDFHLECGVSGGTSIGHRVS